MRYILLLITYCIAFFIGWILCSMATVTFVYAYDSFYNLQLNLPARQGGWDTVYGYDLDVSIILSSIIGGLVGLTLMLLITRSVCTERVGVLRKCPSSCRLTKVLCWFLFLAAAFFLGFLACFSISDALLPTSMILGQHRVTEVLKAIFSYCGGGGTLLFAFRFRNSFTAWILRCRE